jgi:hypothetical protein
LIHQEISVVAVCLAQQESDVWVVRLQVVIGGGIDAKVSHNSSVVHECFYGSLDAMPKEEQRSLKLTLKSNPTLIARRIATSQLADNV